MLTLKITTTQVVEKSVTVNNNSPIQEYVHPEDQTQPTYEMTPGFKPFTIQELQLKSSRLEWALPLNFQPKLPVFFSQDRAKVEYNKVQVSVARKWFRKFPCVLDG